MNVFEVRLTRQAEEQLRGIAIYIAVELKNPDASTELMDDLEEELTRLGKNPEKYRLVDEQPWRDECIRWTKVKNFIVYFIVFFAEWITSSLVTPIQYFQGFSGF